MNIILPAHTWRVTLASASSSEAEPLLVQVCAPTAQDAKTIALTNAEGQGGAWYVKAMEWAGPAGVAGPGQGSFIFFGRAPE